MPISIRGAAFVFGLFILCLLGVRTAGGTTKTGLSGVVFDPVGAILPGASVAVFRLDMALGTGTNQWNI